jgi:hypothetical protein
LESWSAFLCDVLTGLLAAFRSEGILREPLIISENKTLDVSWSVERPAAIIHVLEICSGED